MTIAGDKEDPALDFGFIHFRPNCSVQRQFEIINHDGVHAKWSLAEVEHCVNKDYVSRYSDCILHYACCSIFVQLY